MRNILVTGSSGNLGKAVIDKFTQSGDRILATVSPGKKEKSPVVDNQFTYEADLSNENSVNEAVMQMIAEHGSIDIAIFTVGGFATGNLATTDGTLIQKMMTQNFYATYYAARVVFVHMSMQKRGRIVFIGSRPSLNPSEGKDTLAYALSKSLLFTLAGTINASGTDVVASVVVPGTLDTPVNRGSQPQANFSDWVTPEAVAATIHFLSSNEGKALREPVLKLYGNS